MFRHIHHTGFQLAVLVLATLVVVVLVNAMGLLPERRIPAPPPDVGKTDLPDFRTAPDAEAKKARFFGFLRPIVAAENLEIRHQRRRLKALAAALRGGEELADEQWAWIKTMAKRYRVDLRTHTRRAVAEALLEKVDIVPPSLVLAQAAKESAWGTSRFAREGNNLFGEWCFTKGCGMVPARRAEGKTHEVEAFDTVRASVESYLRNLNSHPTYKQLRTIRARLRDQGEPLSGFALAGGLESYSEQGQKYVREVRAMIRRNELGQAANEG